MGTGVCSAPQALHAQQAFEAQQALHADSESDSFVFSVGADGRLISHPEVTSPLRAFAETQEEKDGGRKDRLLLFASPEYGERPVADTLLSPRAVRASPEILHAIETTALRYASHRALRRAGLSVTDWARLYRANIEVESAYNPAARSEVGAIGLGQLMPGTARDLGVDPHDLAQNLDGSARYLLRMLDLFGDGSLALAAYNAGPEAITRHGGIPPYPETRGHVARVTAVFQRLRGDLS